MEYTGALVQNKEVWSPEHFSDCYLVQVSLRKGARKYVLYCDGSLKGLAIPTAWAKKLTCKQLITAAAFVIHIMWWKYPMASHARTLCRTLWYGEKLNVIARRLDFCYLHISKIMFKASITLLTGITRGTFWILFYILYSTCFICRPSDPTVLEDPWIWTQDCCELWLWHWHIRRSNHSARSHPQLS
jgi:hypothetical protein